MIILYIEIKKVYFCSYTMLIANGPLVDRFQNSHVEFSRRQANRVAHELTHAALFNPSPHIIDDVPTCI